MSTASDPGAEFLARMMGGDWLVQIWDNATTAADGHVEGLVDLRGSLESEGDRLILAVSMGSPDDIAATLTAQGYADAVFAEYACIRTESMQFRSGELHVDGTNTDGTPAHWIITGYA